MKQAITQATVIDGRGKTYNRATIIIHKGKIVEVGDAREVSIPRDTKKIDGRGLTVLPGLIDCHVHLGLGGEADVIRTIQEDAAGMTLLKAADYAQKTLEAGFTTVRDLGYRDHSIFSLIQAIESHLTPGPRIVAVGLAICMTGGHARFIGRQADGPVDIVTAVREQLAAGATAIKFIASGGVLTPGTTPDSPQLTIEELQAGIGEASRAGRHSAAHAHGSRGMKNAILAGVKSIEHGTLLNREAADLILEHEVFLVPTLSALATTADNGLECGIPESVVGKAQSMRAKHEASFKKAHQMGIKIAMGTDAGTPFNFHGENAQELERMVALGMTPMEAIQSATSQAANLLNIQDRVGTIEVGKEADLVIVDGNPIRKIGHLLNRDKLVGVMQAGQFVSGPLKSANS